MAIKITSNGSEAVKKTLKALGIPQSLLNQAEELGIVVDQVALGNYTVSGGGKVYATIKVSTKAITLAQQGGLGPSSLSAIVSMFEDGLQKAIQGQKAMGVESVSMTEAPESHKPNFKKLFSPDPASVPYSPPATTPNGSLKGDLCAAGVLYLPVKASSAGSVYYTFAIRDDLKLACRYKDDTLSIRAEGSGLHNVEEPLKSLGMTISKGPVSGYASVHLHTPSIVQAQKALGACLAILGIHKFTDIADTLKVIKMGGS